MTKQFKVGDVVVVDDVLLDIWEIGLVIRVDCPCSGCVHVIIREDQDEEYCWTEQECNITKIGVL